MSWGPPEQAIITLQVLAWPHEKLEGRMKNFFTVPYQKIQVKLQKTKSNFER